MTGLTLQTPTVQAKDIVRNWHFVDVRGMVLGRCATDIAERLIGKGKSTFVSHLDVGDHVVVVNAKEIILTGRKADQKVYTRYSGYPGGLKKRSFAHVMNQSPRKVIENAVSGMLPKNKLRDRRMTRLYVFADDKHPYGDKFNTTK